MVDYRRVLVTSDPHRAGDQILRSLAAAPQDFFVSSYSLGRVSVDVESYDARLLEDICATLPRAQTSRAAQSEHWLKAVISARDAEAGLLTLSASNPAALDAQDLILGLDSPGFPFRLVENDERTVFAYRDDELPLFSFRGSECVVRNRDHWRDAVGFLLLHRIYRLRADAIFFHAASVDVNGHGVLFVGPKGAGKSTTALALAARGCPLLGDETACFVPERNLLEPFRRPVGIKPGPRAGAITDALRRASCPIDREIVRIDIDALLTTPRPADVPLRAVVFLEPFQAEPHLKEIRAGRREMAALQPSASSLVNAPRGRRVLQLAQLLSSAKIFRLHPADPDATASRLIGELGDRLS